ncbi:hypothetical protein XH87_25980 [Bradyrhizobium sp. CCBAU 53415]|nr:hypothetical protein [Bradyrhizobium sp. CCBAU 53415]
MSAEKVLPLLNLRLNVAAPEEVPGASGSSFDREAPRPADRTGLGGALLLAGLARPRPEQGVAFTALVIEQVRVIGALNEGSSSLSER